MWYNLGMDTLEVDSTLFENQKRGNNMLTMWYLTDLDEFYATV